MFASRFLQGSNVKAQLRVRLGEGQGGDGCRKQMCWMQPQLAF